MKTPITTTDQLMARYGFERTKTLFNVVIYTKEQTQIEVDAAGCYMTIHHGQIQSYEPAVPVKEALRDITKRNFNLEGL